MEIGLKGKIETIVDDSKTAAAVGSGDLHVFATPLMVALMEEASVRAVAEELEDGQSSVGTKVSILHTAATPVGMRVWAEAELVLVENRRLEFSVSAYDEAGLIGSGTHERFIINKDKFMAKASEKFK